MAPVATICTLQLLIWTAELHHELLPKRAFRDSIDAFTIPDSKAHGTNMGPIWGRQDPGGTHVGPMNFAIWDVMWALLDDIGNKIVCLNQMANILLI